MMRVPLWLNGRQKSCGNECYRAMISVRMRRTWADEEYKERVLHKIRLGGSKRPNNPESMFAGFLIGIGLHQFTYVGGGSKSVGGLYPDFIATDGSKRTIEVFGDYWHAGEDPADRVAAFAKSGWKCFVVWEHEFLNPKQKAPAIDPTLISRLYAFAGEPAVLPTWDECVRRAHQERAKWPQRSHAK